jgi:hypothetical protein
VNHRDNDLLTSRRGVTSEWHFDQAEALLTFALKHDSASALVYGALEARNALERFVFEMAVVATGGHLTEAQMRTARRQDGAFQLLEHAMSHYRSHLLFTNLTLEVGQDPFRVAVPNLVQFRRLRTELSDYCHFQVDPAATVNHPGRSWFIAGTAAVKATLDFLRALQTEVTGLIKPESMSPEVREVFRGFVENEIDLQTARTRLNLMRPVLEERLRRSGRQPGFRGSEEF